MVVKKEEKSVKRVVRNAKGEKRPSIWVIPDIMSTVKNPCTGLKGVKDVYCIKKLDK